MKHVGKYRAIVVDVNDPEKRGRIRVECPAVLGKCISNWALPCFSPGFFSIPNLKDLVWMEFESGEKDYPVWTGAFYTTEVMLNSFGVYNPKNKIILDSNGNVLKMMTSGDVEIKAKSVFRGMGTTALLSPAPYYTKSESNGLYL